MQGHLAVLALRPECEVSELFAGGGEGSVS